MKLKSDSININKKNKLERQEELETLNETYNSTITLVGGTPQDFSVNQWREWASTILYDPFEVSFDLVNFSIFLQNDQKKAFNDALSYYYNS